MPRKGSTEDNRITIDLDEKDPNYQNMPTGPRTGLSTSHARISSGHNENFAREASDSYLHPYGPPELRLPGLD